MRRLLDVVQAIEQLVRRQEGLELQAGVEKIVLLHPAVGRGLEIRGHLLDLAAVQRVERAHCIVEIRLLVPKIRTEGDVGGVPEARDLHRHGLYGKTHRRPWLLELQRQPLHERIVEEDFLRHVLRRRFDELEGMLVHIVGEKGADLSVVDGLFKAVRDSRRAGIHIEDKGDDKLLPQAVFLGKHAVVGKDLQILYMDLIIRQRRHISRSFRRAGWPASCGSHAGSPSHHGRGRRPRP